MLTNLAYPFDQSLVSHSNFLIPTPEYLQTFLLHCFQASSSQAGLLPTVIITQSHHQHSLASAYRFILRQLTFRPVVIFLALSTQVTWSLLIQVSLQLFYALFEALTLWQLVLAIV